jgi:hypothetical protein
MRNRKLFFATWFLATFLGACFAQDVIVTKDARKINAKVTEINIDDIKYKNFDNQDGPTYTLLKSAVSSILYQNGTVETFNTATSPGLTPTSAPAPTTSATRAQPAQQRPAFSYSNMSTDDPFLYQRYASGRRQAGFGRILLIVGAVSSIGGVAALSSDSDHDTSLGSSGAIFLAIGGICITAGIPVLIIGGVKKNSAMSEYRRRYADASGKGAPHFQLNVHTNGLGLAYVF